MRVVCREPAGSPVVVCYLVGPHLDDELRAALPGCTILATHEDGDPGQPLADLAPDGPVVLVGYSAGCQGVRARLREGGGAADRIVALVLVDGVHASWPPAAWQLDVWRPWIARAKRGELLVALTHTLQRYTERLEKPFASTATMARLVTDLPIVDPPRDESVVVRVGTLLVESHWSHDTDADAHRRQQTAVLPRVLRDHVAPWLAQIPQPEPVDIVDAIVAAAEADLDVREAGANDGPRIREYLRPWGIPAPAHWCGVALAAWIVAGARRARRPAPIAGSPRAKAYREQLLALERWVDGAELRARPALARRGCVAVWHRGAPGAATGHVGLVTGPVEDGVLPTIEGNSGQAGDRVARMRRSLDDPLLLGVGYLGDVEREPAPALEGRDLHADVAAGLEGLET